MGPVAELGATLMHEHVFGLSPEILWNWPDIPEGWDLEARAGQAAAKLEALRAAGIDTIVDLTVVGLGRYVPAVQRVAERTGVNIVAATGLYTYDALPPYFANRGPGTLFGGPDRLASSSYGTSPRASAGPGVKAGDPQVRLRPPRHDRGLRAGVPGRRRGAPGDRRARSPRTPTAASRGGLEQQRLLASLGRRPRPGGASATRATPRTSAYLEELIADGSYLGMDRFGIDTISPFEDRVAIVAALCARGHAGRMVLGHDSYCFNDRFDADVVRRRHPNYHLLHISRDVLPELRGRGVTEDQIHQMLVDNPRRIFG